MPSGTPFTAVRFPHSNPCLHFSLSSLLLVKNFLTIARLVTVRVPRVQKFLLFKKLKKFPIGALEEILLISFYFSVRSSLCEIDVRSEERNRASKLDIRSDRSSSHSCLIQTLIRTNVTGCNLSRQPLNTIPRSFSSKQTSDKLFPLTCFIELISLISALFPNL